MRSKLVPHNPFEDMPEWELLVIATDIMQSKATGIIPESLILPAEKIYRILNLHGPVETFSMQECIDIAKNFFDETLIWRYHTTF